MTMMVRDDSDLAHLSPERREIRLKVRREIEASVVHIGESTSDRYYRERYEAKRAEFLERKQVPQQAAEAEKQSASWTDFINSRFNEAIETADKIGEKMVRATGEVFGEHRVSARPNWLRKPSGCARRCDRNSKQSSLRQRSEPKPPKRGSRA